MATILEECTTEKQRSVMRFLVVKDSMRRIFVKKCFLFMVGSVCRVKQFIIGSRNSLKDVQKSLMMPDQVALLGW
jgi:L-rhamnose isomerase